MESILILEDDENLREILADARMNEVQGQLAAAG